MGAAEAEAEKGGAGAEKGEAEDGCHKGRLSAGTTFNALCG
ncbi:hypothetical protein STTU_2794 [Streptomyces sp. Tu6071]|nr:hypothetical protein STTU_2794 [Streptomyces sp. Tu6071]